MLRAGVIGCGYWGPNLIRNFLENDATDVVQIADLSPESLHIMQKRYPALEITTAAEGLIANPALDMVVIATPVSMHFPLARMALEEGKHVFLEKPMTASSREALELVELAERKGLAIFVDHTFLFTGAVRKLKELVVSGELGDIQYVDSTRMNLGLYQHDVSVIWDIGPHDVSILNYLCAAEPEHVSSVAMSHLDTQYDIAYVLLRYGSLLAHLTLSWLAPVKVRQILIGGTKKMVVYDDLENIAKVKVYDCGAQVARTDVKEVRSMLVSYRRGDMYAPRLDNTEALKVEVDYIVKCLETGERDPVNGGRAGLAVVRAIEAAERSARAGGGFRGADTVGLAAEASHEARAGD